MTSPRDNYMDTDVQEDIITCITQLPKARQESHYRSSLKSIRSLFVAPRESIFEPLGVLFNNVSRPRFLRFMAVLGAVSSEIFGEAFAYSYSDGQVTTEQLIGEIALRAIHSLAHHNGVFPGVAAEDRPTHKADALAAKWMRPIIAVQLSGCEWAALLHADGNALGAEGVFHRAFRRMDGAKNKSWVFNEDVPAGLALAYAFRREGSFVKALLQAFKKTAAAEPKNGAKTKKLSHRKGAAKKAAAKKAAGELSYDSGSEHEGEEAVQMSADFEELCASADFEELCASADFEELCAPAPATTKKKRNASDISESEVVGLPALQLTSSSVKRAAIDPTLLKVQRESIDTPLANGNAFPNLANFLSVGAPFINGVGYNFAPQARQLPLPTQFNQAPAPKPAPGVDAQGLNVLDLLNDPFAASLYGGPSSFRGSGSAGFEFLPDLDVNNFDESDFAAELQQVISSLMPQAIEEPFRNAGDLMLDDVPFSAKSATTGFY